MELCGPGRQHMFVVALLVPRYLRGGTIYPDTIVKRCYVPVPAATLQANWMITIGPARAVVRSEDT